MSRRRIGKGDRKPRRVKDPMQSRHSNLTSGFGRSVASTSRWPLLLAAFVALSACKSNSGKALAGLLVEVTSDLAFPKDIDQVMVEIDRSRGEPLIEKFPLSDAQPLPARIFVEAESGRFEVKVKATGWSGRTLRSVRTARVEVPNTRVARLRLDLQWLCNDKVEPNADIDRPATASSSCRDDLTCLQGECVDDGVAVEELPGITGPLPEARPSDVCFDALACFEVERRVDVDVERCAFERPGPGVGLNVSMLIAAGSAGVCTETSCVVPLNGFAPLEGWWEDGSLIRLPLALCSRLRDGRIKGVLLSTSCPTKTVSIATCPVARVNREPDVLPDAGPPVENACPGKSPPDLGSPCGACGGFVKCDGSCSVAEPARFGEPCGSCGGKIRCDGTCSVSTPSNFDQPCGSCGGKVRCDGTCSVPTPSNFDQPCGSCGGKVRCDGTCSVSTPSNFDQPCGSCGGKVRCDGTCSVPTPSNFDQPCGSCGGKVRCDGTCSVSTPSSFDQACGSCGGKVRCDGTCSVSTPSNFDQPCGSCGGKVQCDGSCSVPTPSNFNQPCGSCGGKVQCDGSCSVPTPPNLGQPCAACGGVVVCGGACVVPPAGVSCAAYADHAPPSGPNGWLIDATVWDYTGAELEPYAQHAATQFCNERGYSTAESYTIIQSPTIVGTWRYGSGGARYCDMCAWYFDFIRCRRPICCDP